VAEGNQPPDTALDRALIDIRPCGKPGDRRMRKSWSSATAEQDGDEVEQRGRQPQTAAMAMQTQGERHEAVSQTEATVARGNTPLGGGLPMPG